MPNCFRLSSSERQYIESIKTNGVLCGSEWDSLKKSPSMVALKASIRKKLQIIQKGCCAYCGNKYHVTSEDHIEHIAPKAASRYPEFMFKEQNLVLACQYCNGFLKKGARNTVANKHKIYKNCVFKLVHPYFDNPDDHYAYTDSDDKVLIQAKTPQGSYSIKVFKLDEIIQSEARAKDAVYNHYKLKPSHEKIIDLIMNYHAV